MPLDVLGRTRATLMHSTSFPGPRGMGNLLKVHRARDRLLQLLVFNEEFLVDVVHQTASITSLPFVHTARRSYRLDDPVSYSDFRIVDFRLYEGKSREPYHLEEGEVVTRFP